MMLQMFIFAAFFMGFGLFSIFRRKRLIGFTFVLLGLMILAVAWVVISIYPDKSPF